MLLSVKTNFDKNYKKGSISWQKSIKRNTKEKSDMELSKIVKIAKKRKNHLAIKTDDS